MAAARGAVSRQKDGIPPFESTSAWGENQIVSGYMEPDIGAVIDDALKQMGMSGKKLISTETSEEATDVDKTSPVRGFKGYPR